MIESVKIFRAILFNTFSFLFLAPAIKTILQFVVSSTSAAFITYSVLFHGGDLRETKVVLGEIWMPCCARNIIPQNPVKTKPSIFHAPCKNLMEDRSFFSLQFLHTVFESAPRFGSKYCGSPARNRVRQQCVYNVQENGTRLKISSGSWEGIIGGIEICRRALENHGP